jgi:hypothetical protein
MLKQISAENSGYRWDLNMRNEVGILCPSKKMHICLSRWTEYFVLRRKMPDTKARVSLTFSNDDKHPSKYLIRGCVLRTMSTLTTWIPSPKNWGFGLYRLSPPKKFRPFYYCGKCRDRIRLLAVGHVLLWLLIPRQFRPVPAHVMWRWQAIPANGDISDTTSNNVMQTVFEIWNTNTPASTGNYCERIINIHYRMCCRLMSQNITPEII